MCCACGGGQSPRDVVDDGTVGDDETPVDPAIQEFVDEAAAAATAAENLANGASDSLDTIRTRASDFDTEFGTAQTESQKATDAADATAVMLVNAQSNENNAELLGNLKD